MPAMEMLERFGLLRRLSYVPSPRHAGRGTTTPAACSASASEKICERVPSQTHRAAGNAGSSATKVNGENSAKIPRCGGFDCFSSRSTAEQIEYKQPATNPARRCTVVPVQQAYGNSMFVDSDPGTAKLGVKRCNEPCPSAVCSCGAMAAFRVRFSSRLQNSWYPPSLSRDQDTVHIHAAFAAARAARVEGATPKSGIDRLCPRHGEP